MSNHAIDNARAWAGIICEAMEALRTLEEGGRAADPVTFEGDTFDHADDLRERIQEMPLCVEVRDGWRQPGGERGEAEEFSILLSTGGPALRIYGEIGGRHELQWQDWGTPWTDYYETTQDEDEAIAAFVGLFYLED